MESVFESLNTKNPHIISFKIDVVLQVCVYAVHLLCYQTWLFIVVYQLSLYYVPNSRNGKMDLSPKRTQNKATFLQEIAHAREITSWSALWWANIGSGKTHQTLGRLSRPLSTATCQQSHRMGQVGETTWFHQNEPDW